MCGDLSSKGNRKSYYPIGIDIKDKLCIVIGGGEVAERKALKLLEFGANVLIISPEITKRLEKLSKKGKLNYIKDRYKKEYIKEGFLIFAATDNEEVNFKISEDAKKLGKLINVVDKPDLCNFILPSVVKRGDFIISIFTQGKSPMFSKVIREKLEKEFKEIYELYVDILGNLRDKIKKKISDERKRKEIFENLTSIDILKILEENNIKKLKKKIKEVLIKFNLQDELNDF